MTRVPIRVRLAFTLGMVIVTLLGAAADREPEYFQRIRAMPREHRLALLEVLSRFDSLSSDERAQIRGLDQRLAELSDTDRAKYLDVLRRYSVWLAALPADRRTAVLAMSSEERLTAINSAAGPLAGDGDGRFNPLGIDPSSVLGAGATFRLASGIRVWLSLTPAERAEVQRIPAVNRRLDRLGEIGPARSLEPIQPPLPDMVKVRQRIEDLNLARNLPFRKIQPKDLIRFRDKVQGPLRDAMLLAELPPAKVSQPRLDRFDAALPNWLRDAIDPLPPDAARKRLATIYRLVYPEGEEIPDSVGKPAPSATGPSSKSAPTASPGSTPF